MQAHREWTLLLSIWAVLGFASCEDSAVPENMDARGPARLRDAEVAPTGGTIGTPPIPVVDGTVPDPIGGGGQTGGGGQVGSGGQMGSGGQANPGGTMAEGGAMESPCADGEIPVSNRCELMCFGTIDCPDGTHCNADDVCLEHPDCMPGGDCPMVCVGWCVDGADPNPNPDPDPDPGPGPDPCVPACAAGEMRCFGALIRLCQLDETGCPEWSGSMPCPNGRICENDQCDGQPGCANECFADQAQCVGEDIRRCVEVEPGCLQWGPEEACPDDLACNFNECRCVDECRAPLRECAGEGYRTCALVDGCGVWGPIEACPEGDQCVNGLCRAAPCEHECDFPGVRECVGDLVRSCERDENRCRYWTEAIPCDDERVCRPEGCVYVCEDECPFFGAQSCNGEREILLCNRDRRTLCLGWEPFTECNEGQRCEDGRCFMN